MEPIDEATRNALQKYFESGFKDEKLIKDIAQDQLERAARNAQNAAARQCRRWPKFAAQQAERAAKLRDFLARRGAGLLSLGFTIFLFEYNPYGDELPPPVAPGDYDYGLPTVPPPLIGNPSRGQLIGK